MSARPLSGRSIVITRAVQQSGGLRERLERLGAEVLLLPTIEIIPPESYASLDNALLHAYNYDWLVVTSTNAVRVIGARMAELGVSSERLAHLRSAAVGPSTAKAMETIFLTVDVVPERYVGDALADALKDEVRGQRVLLVRAAVARDVIPDALAATGASVTIADAYRTVIPVDATERARVIFGGKPLPNAVVFTSGSTVMHLLDVLHDTGLSFPREIACISIGPVTSAALRDAGLTVAAEAETASLDALVDVCVRFFTS
jgi:uroporphyrinogen-III synthase